MGIYPEVEYREHDDQFWTQGLSTPCLLLDLAVVRCRYHALKACMPSAEIFYAVKANAEPALLAQLVHLGAGFDVASRGEIDLCLAAGADPERLSYGNTIKKSGDIKYAFDRGVRWFAFDSLQEVRKIAEHAPGSHVQGRVTVHTTGAQWPISRKFGCTPEELRSWMVIAESDGLIPDGVTFHVGSQQQNPDSWDQALRVVAEVIAHASTDGILVKTVNLGGGLPANCDVVSEPLEEFCTRISQAVLTHIPSIPRLIIEPGRYLPSDAGMLRAQVIGVTTRREPVMKQWTYVDIGRFGGLAETEGEAIRYPLVATRDGAAIGGSQGRTVLAGPTCDSADVLYEERMRLLPEDLAEGDHIDFLSTGAYTRPYSSVGFNGFPPLAVHIFDSGTDQAGGSSL